MSVFSERLAAARKKAKLTQQEMGVAIGTSDRGYRYYESGIQEPTVMRAAILAKTLGVSLDYLTGLTDEEK